MPILRALRAMFARRARSASHAPQPASRAPRLAPRRRAFAAPLPALVLLAACNGAPVQWDAIVRAPGAPAAGWRLMLDAAGRPSLGRAPAAPFAPPADACAASLVFAPAKRAEWYAAWWQPRRDGSAALVVSRSIDGGATWTVPVTADARDRSGTGCDRPPPAIAADSASGYVHLAYYLRPPEGAGIWFTHSMDHGAMWHAPVGIFFGDTPARASVAAHGDTVAVGYEYPMPREQRVGVALSRTAGHIFEARVQVSGDNEAAADPRVAVRGPSVAVAWRSRPVGAADSDDAAQTAVRTGTLR